jgi:hypothetical protein
LTTIDTPDGLYCKLPQDAPLEVRGARNSPCMGVPGKRAPTVQECYSDQPYKPLAMRQHVLGPDPIDPNLIAQGIPPDDRATFEENIYAPIEGTPPPPGAAMPQPPPVPSGPILPVMPPGADAGPAAPSSFAGETHGPGPSVGIAHYDPQTGRYAGPDGSVGQQTDLVDPPKSWQDLIFKAVP